MNSYLLFKSLHLIAVVSWMAGLLYLPRIFVYHVENKNKKEATDIFEVMEKRLFLYIMRPAMIITWIFGLHGTYFIFYEIKILACYRFNSAITYRSFRWNFLGLVTVVWNQ